MFVKKSLIIIIFAVIMLLTFSSVCLATETIEFSQVMSWENNMDIFLLGGLDLGSLSAKVANNAAEISGSGFLTDMGGTVRTTVIVDISTSIPVDARTQIMNMMNSMIAGLSENEELRIVTFGESVTVLQDFTNDRYDLAMAAEKIAFNDNMSMVYDAVYNTIPELLPVNGGPCYYRTIVITDGVDETNIGITKEELLIALQNDTYPINVIEVSQNMVGAENKDLASLVRVSKGKYANLYVGCDTESILSSFSTNDIFWMRLVVPGELLDGSTRQVNITDGTHSIEFDTKLQVYDTPVAPGETTLAPAETELTTEPSAESDAATELSGETNAVSPTETGSQPGIAEDESSNGEETTPEKSNGAFDPVNFLQDHLIIILVACIGVAIVVAAVVVIIIVTKNKKAKQPTVGPVGGNGIDTNSIPDGSGSETVLIGTKNVMGGAPSIRLRELSSGGVLDFVLNQELLVGRSHDCQMCLTDPSVSRKQFKISWNGNALITNMSHSNITQVNGGVINQPTVLSVGDKIICGNTTIAVENIQGFGPIHGEKINVKTSFVNI